MTLPPMVRLAEDWVELGLGLRLGGPWYTTLRERPEDLRRGRYGESPCQLLLKDLISVIRYAPPPRSV